MERNGIGGNIRHFDVLNFARKKIKDVLDYKQGTVADYFGIDTTAAHDAYADCMICAQILFNLVRM